MPVCAGFWDEVNNMTRIYEIREEGLQFVPIVYSDDEGWLKKLCRHRHFSYKEARKCLTKALPRYMKYQRVIA